MLSKKDEYRLVCGIPFPTERPDLLCHLELFLRAPELQETPEDIFMNGEQVFYEGQGRLEHVQVCAKILWPKQYQWHEWAEQIVRKACEADYLCISGCGSSSK